MYYVTFWNFITDSSFIAYDTIKKIQIVSYSI